VHLNCEARPALCVCSPGPYSYCYQIDTVHSAFVSPPLSGTFPLLEKRRDRAIPLRPLPVSRRPFFLRSLLLRLATSPRYSRTRSTPLMLFHICSIVFGVLEMNSGGAGSHLSLFQPAVPLLLWYRSMRRWGGRHYWLWGCFRTFLISCRAPTKRVLLVGFPLHAWSRLLYPCVSLASFPRRLFHIAGS